MFRLFLRKKILGGDTSRKASAGQDKPRRGSQGRARELNHKRNRRVFERYSVDYKHLTLMNEQDILLVREISAKGFSTEVSPRGYERLNVGDLYDARMRYFGDIYSLQARVAWKDQGFVGFEIVKSSRETLVFLKRLLKPVEIAASMKMVDSGFTVDGPIGKTWYHGDEESDLYTWRHPETGQIKAWQLSVGHEYIEWSENRGLVTGQVRIPQRKEGLLQGKLDAPMHAQDSVLDPRKRQLAMDIIMALPIDDVRNALLETLSTSTFVPR